MPLYDYRCARCSATVELLHGINNEELQVHDECGGTLERIFSATSVHFKGSGWAKLDRRGAEGGTAGSADTAATTPSAAASATPSAAASATPSATPSQALSSPSSATPNAAPAKRPAASGE